MIWKCCRKLVFAKALKTIPASLAGREAGQRSVYVVGLFPGRLFDVCGRVPRDAAAGDGACTPVTGQERAILIDYGFRLPSAFDNRPLNFDEFYERINQAIFVSATPGDFELEYICPSSGTSYSPDRFGRPGNHLSDRQMDKLMI